MGKTPEQKAEEKIETELERQGWKQIDRDTSKTGYSKYVQLPDGREADYVLFSTDNPLAIIEAKRKSKKPENHLQQARNYAKAIESGFKYSGVYSVPFVFASNGDRIIIDDLREGTPNSREIDSFYTVDDISRRLGLNIASGLDWLATHTHEDTDKELWENQIEAISRIKEAIQNQKQKILVSMATGSGKTRLSMALTYQLLESGYANRILFVPDTEQLERDALQAFQSYDPLGSPRFDHQYITRGFDEYKEEGGANVVVSTIQKAHYELKNNLDERSVGEFDVVIADECHRGIYNSEEGYGRVLDFYDSIEIGLTATPHQKTKQRYNNNHVYSYNYHKALEDDKVVPFRPYVVQTEATMDGIVYDGEHYPPSDFGTNVLIQDTHRKVAREIADIADINDELTLVFAQNIDHANVIAEDLREVFEEELQIANPKEFVKTITSEDRHAKATLDNFDDKRRNPRVAVTVDMVSTGVDVRPLNNVVFLRAVKSSILYNQMVGRGTRNTPKKEFFRLFDCIGVLEYHDDNMFSTENVEIQYSDSDSSQDGSTADSPKKIEDADIDKIVKRHQAYPLEDDFVEANTFISAVSEVIEARSEDVARAVEDADTLEQANSEIENVLTDEWRFFTQEYILDAVHSGIDSLFELACEVIVGHNSIRDNSERAKKVVNSKYDLSDEQQRWVEMFVERSVIEKKTMSKRQLLEKPFSDEGGYDEALELFQNPEVGEVIDTFNSELLSIPLTTRHKSGDSVGKSESNRA